MDINILKAHGVDYESGVARCLGDPAFYEQILLLFIKDDTFAKAETAFANKDRKRLFEALHELKGACGNAALTVLFDSICPLVELLRGGDAPEEEISRLFLHARVAYEQAREGIARANGQQSTTA